MSIALIYKRSIYTNFIILINVYNIDKVHINTHSNIFGSSSLNKILGLLDKATANPAL